MEKYYKIKANIPTNYIADKKKTFLIFEAFFAPEDIVYHGKSSQFNGDDRESNVDARPTENRKTAMVDRGKEKREVAEGRKVVEGC